MQTNVHKMVIFGGWYDHSWLYLVRLGWMGVVKLGYVWLVKLKLNNIGLGWVMFSEQN